ncbi:MAG: hypothetical protein GXP40_10640 [Chloroflexi bacterium]|nr:hypothetical protein [Chloroflexota bacterium]
MKDLRNAVILLFIYLIIVLGIAQVEEFEKQILNFRPAFFVMLALAVFVGLVLPARLRVSMYVLLGVWAVIYAGVWLFHWRFLSDSLTIQELGVQFLLIEISAGLSYYVGRYIGQVDDLIKGLAVSTYPNRTIDIRDAEERIKTEITRSRRYNSPLSMLVLQVEQGSEEDQQQQYKSLQRDLLRRFAFAKVGQIINDSARQTDLIISDQARRFIVLCPEVDYQNSTILAERIRRAVSEKVNARITWGAASFPREALTFDELLAMARRRLRSSSGAPALVDQNVSSVDQVK